MFGEITWKLRNYSFRTVMIGLTALAVLSSASACSAGEKPEIRVWIGMTTAEFNDQDGAKQAGVKLNEEGADLWGSDDPIRLVLVLPKGEVVMDFGYQIGVYLTSSDISFLEQKPASPSVTSLSMPALYSKVHIPEQLAELEALCDELEAKLGEEFVSQPTDKEELDRARSGEQVDGHTLCKFVGKDTDVRVSFRSTPSRDAYYPTLYWDEIIPVD